MPRTRSPPFRIRDRPRRVAAPTYPQRHGPESRATARHRLRRVRPCPPATPAGVPAGQGPARWEVVLRLRASAVLPGWPLGKVNSNLACSGIPSPPGTPSPGPSAAWPCWIAATPASWRIRPCEGRPEGCPDAEQNASGQPSGRPQAPVLSVPILPVPPTVPSQPSDRAPRRCRPPLPASACADSQTSLPQPGEARVARSGEG